MSRRRLVSSATLLGLLACLSASAGAQRGQAPFRSQTVVVPVDVRVIDNKTGKPVTDLTQADFTILEDGVRQAIRHFSIETFSESSTVAAPAKPAPRLAPGSTIAPETHRTFLIVLGRGRLQPPGKGVDGMIHLVREKLLPQDQVAVFAYDRATDFTTDHERIAQVLERFKKQHESIEGKLKSMLGGLAAVYGSREIPPVLRGEIDAIFDGPRASNVKALPPATVTDAGQTAAMTRAATEALQQAALRPAGSSVPNAVDPVAALGLDMSFDDYVSTSAQTMQDVGNLYTGVEYLRYLEGEKHLVFVTENGLFLPRLEADASIAAAANDARVVIDVYQSGGMPVDIPAGRAASMSVPFSQMFARGTSRTIATLTGGQFTSLTTGSAFVDMVDQTTRSTYLLGYSPSNPNFNGRYRRIVVRVNRPGVTLFYRHGYDGLSDTLPPLDRQQALTYSRIAAAGSYVPEVKDIKVTMKASVSDPGTEVASVTIDAIVDASTIAFHDANGLHTSALDVTVFCGDANQTLVGQSWQKMDLKLSEPTYQRFLAEGVPVHLKIPVTAPPRYVKIVVYDASADHLGTTVVKLGK